MKRLALIFALVSCGTDGAEPPGTCTLGETVACDCSPGSVGSQTCNDNGEFGTCGNCSAPDPDPIKVNFQAQIVPILNRSCGTNGVSGCHARDAYGANKNQDCRGWLTLE